MPPKSSVEPPKASPAVQKTKWKKNEAPKKALTTQDQLKRLFTTLCRQIDGGHFSNAVKTCDKILRIQPNDVNVRQTKLFALLQTEQYDAALALIDLDEDLGNHAFERAYCLYRMQRESAAQEVLDELKKDQGDEGNRGVMHLEAQLKYREGSYQEAFDLYNQLLDTAEPNSEEHSDIMTNLQAAQSHLEFMERGYLQALDALPASVTSILESAPPPVQLSPPVAAPAIDTNVSAETKAPRPPKKVRMSRVPAGVIPGVTPPPDPERWLKKSERSSFGPGRKRKGHGGGGATQGSSTVDHAPAPSAAVHSSKSGGGKKRRP